MVAHGGLWVPFRGYGITDARFLNGCKHARGLPVGLGRMLPDQGEGGQFHAENPPSKASGKLIWAFEASIRKSAS